MRFLREYDHLWFAASLALALALAIVLFAWLFRRVWPARESGGMRAIGVRLAISFSMLLATFAALETYFAGFYVTSDGYGTTLAGTRWFELYWNPINQLGYRDRDHVWGDDRALIVVGDSFMAGHGVRRVEDRLSGVLEKGLGDGGQAAVVAQNGWDSTQEFEGLASYPRKPDRIVVSYYINDIEGAARIHGNAPPSQLLRQPPKAVRWLVVRSHFVNWLYWRVIRGQFGTIYWDWLKAAYDDDAVLDTHMGELQRFMDLATETNAELDFVVWPNLDYIEGSRPFTDKVVKRLRERGANVLDLGERFAGRDPRGLVVNEMDGHPNPRTHAEVAGWLLESWVDSESEKD
ncbi:MAG: SGNH/GDSL hydrolase family protein [Planctomycetota bacterium]